MQPLQQQLIPEQPPQPNLRPIDFRVVWTPSPETGRPASKGSHHPSLWAATQAFNTSLQVIERTLAPTSGTLRIYQFDRKRRSEWVKGVMVLRHNPNLPE